MLKLLLTYDYELFFSPTKASEDDVLIEPTKLILKMLGEEGINATFFVDMAMLKAFKQEMQTFSIKKIEEQIKFLASKGQDIQLHIHPGWYTASLLEHGWSFRDSDYSLAAFIETKEYNVADIIRECKEELYDLLKNITGNHEVLGFRAGGFCIEPTEQIIKELFSNGIEIDSSICKGKYSIGENQKYDFRKVPKETNWRISASEGINTNSMRNDSILEIPVGTYSKIPNKWLLTRRYPSVKNKQLKGSPTKVKNNKRGINKILNRVYNSFFMPVEFSLDVLHYEALLEITNYYRKIAKKNKKDIYIALIGHPKFSSETLVENTRRYLRKVKMMDDVTFTTVQEVSKEWRIRE